MNRKMIGTSESGSRFSSFINELLQLMALNSIHNIMKVKGQVHQTVGGAVMVV